MKYKKYPSYKDSGVEWLGEIPSEWYTKKLKYISDIQTGTTPSTSNELYFNDDKGTPWVKPDDLKGLISISKSKKYLTNDGVKVSRLIRAGSVLVCGIGTIGKYGIAGVDLTTNQQINAVTFNSTLHDEYGKYLVDASKEELDKYSNGNVVKILNTESQKNISHSYPPLQEQQQIAKFLDNATKKIDTLITKQEKLIELLKEKRQAVISHAVTKGLNPDVKMKDSGVEWLGDVPEHWDIKLVKYLLNDKVGIKIGPFGSALKLDDMVNTGYKVYGQENVIKRNFDLGHRFISQSKFESMIIYKIEPEDILITMMGTVGNCIVIPKDIKVGIIDSHLIKIRTNQELITPNYFVNMIDKSNIVKVQLDLFSKGSIMQGLNSSIIKSLIFPMPPVNEQVQILSYLDDKTSKIDTLIENSKQSIKLLKEKKAALISAAVTGKIDVRETI